MISQLKLGKRRVGIFNFFFFFFLLRLRNGLSSLSLDNSNVY